MMEEELMEGLMVLKDCKPERATRVDKKDIFKTLMTLYEKQGGIPQSDFSNESNVVMSIKFDEWVMMRKWVR